MKIDPEQLSMDGMDISSSNTESDDYVVSVKNALFNEITDSDYRKMISVEQKKGYIAIKAKSNLAAKIIVRKAFFRIEVAKKYGSFFNNAEIEYNNDVAIIKVERIEDVIAFAFQLGVITMETLSEFGGESFGCCSRYVECSDARQCIHPDILFAIACAYRKNLEKGKIFYGKNKNI